MLRADAQDSTTAIDQQTVVRGHHAVGLGDQALRRGRCVNRLAVAQPPIPVPPTQIGVEGGVAGPRETATLVEWAVDEQKPSGDEPVRSACDQTKRHGPWGDVGQVRGEDRVHRGAGPRWLAASISTGGRTRSVYSGQSASQALMAARPSSVASLGDQVTCGRQRAIQRACSPEPEAISSTVQGRAGRRSASASRIGSRLRAVAGACWSPGNNAAVAAGSARESVLAGPAVMEVSSADDQRYRAAAGTAREWQEPYWWTC